MIKITTTTSGQSNRRIIKTDNKAEIIKLNINSLLTLLLYFSAFYLKSH